MSTGRKPSSKTPDVFFWMPNPSQHMAPCLRAFADRWNGEVTGVWAAPMNAERSNLGWRRPDFGALKELQLEQDDARARQTVSSIVENSPGSIHVFSGLKAYPRIHQAFLMARQDQTNHLGIIGEPFRGWGIRRVARWPRAFIQSRAYVKHVKLVLAMGRAGVSFYRRIGFRDEVVFPFIYQSPPGNRPVGHSVSEPISLVYIGKFDKRKGVEDAIKGLACTKCRNWKFTVIGDGPERGDLERLAERVGIEDKVNWLGVVRHEELVGMLPQFDAALVPSRFDGWGAIPNEALQAGVATIVSDGCSSKDLIQYSGAGLVVPARSPRALADAVDTITTSPAKLEEMKRAALAYAESISGSSVARYLAEVLEFSALTSRKHRPRPPWEDREATRSEVQMVY